MSNAQTIARAIIEVGTSGVEGAKDELETLEAKLNRLDAAYEKGDITLSAYAKRTQKLKTEMADLGQGMELAEKAAKKFNTTQEQLDSLAPKVAKGSKNVQLGFLELSRAFEDAQYGLRGVLNNIPTTIQMFGGPAGLAAGVSATAVAFTMLQPKIQSFFAALSGTGPKVFDQTLQGIKDKIEALEKKEVKFDFDLQTLRSAKETLEEINKSLAAYRAIRDRPNSIQEERGKLLSDAVVESAGGAENLGNVIEKIRKRDKTFANGQGQAQIQKEALENEIRQEQAAVSSIAAMGGDDQGQGLVHKEALQKAQVALAKLNETIQTEGRNKIDALVGDLTKGEEKARVEIRKMLGANAGDFKAAGVKDIFGFEVGQASNEEITARRKEKSTEENMRRMAGLTKSLDEKKRQRNAEIEESVDFDNDRQNQRDDEAKQKREHEAELTRKAAEHRQHEAEQRRKDLESGLGNEFIAAGQQRMLEINNLKGKPRQQAMAAFRQQMPQVAFRQMVGNGVDPARASELSQEAPAFLGRDLNRQLNQLSTTTGNKSQPELQSMLHSVLSSGGAVKESLHAQVGFNGTLQQTLSQQQEAMNAMGSTLIQQGQKVQGIGQAAQRLTQEFATRQRNGQKR